MTEFGTAPPNLKFTYSEKATKFCEIFPLTLIIVHTIKSKGKISQNFVAFSEYMNFKLGVQFQIHSFQQKTISGHEN